MKGYTDALRQTIYGTGVVSTSDFFEISVYDAVKQIPRNAETQYDQVGHAASAFSCFGTLTSSIYCAFLQNENVDRQTDIGYTNHSNITLLGNTWQAYLLPETVNIARDTVLEFTFFLKGAPEKGFIAVSRLVS